MIPPAGGVYNATAKRPHANSSDDELGEEVVPPRKIRATPPEGEYDNVQWEEVTKSSPAAVPPKPIRFQIDPFKKRAKPSGILGGVLPTPTAAPSSPRRKPVIGPAPPPRLGGPARPPRRVPLLSTTPLTRPPPHPWKADYESSSGGGDGDVNELLAKWKQEGGGDSSDDDVFSRRRAGVAGAGEVGSGTGGRKRGPLCTIKAFWEGRFREIEEKKVEARKNAT